MNMGLKHIACGVGALSIIGLFACNNRVAQCNKLIDGVNNATKSIEDSAKKLGGTDAAEFEGISKALDGASKTIADVQLADEKLKGYQGDYVKVVTRMADAMRAAKTAIEKKDQAGATKATADFKAADTEEDGVRANITTYCSGG